MRLSPRPDATPHERVASALTKVSSLPPSVGRTRSQFTLVAANPHSEHSSQYGANARRSAPELRPAAMQISLAFLALHDNGRQAVRVRPSSCVSLGDVPQTSLLDAVDDWFGPLAQELDPDHLQVRVALLRFREVQEAGDRCLQALLELLVGQM